MKNSTDLFELIKSLEKNEKRYFKLFASLQEGEKNHLKLFNSIDRQQTYNEESIRKEYAHEKFIKHVSKEKVRLYRLIMKSLELYHSNMDVDTVLKSSLHQLKILFQKGLYKQCEKLINKTKQVSEKYEKHLVLLELSDWEIKLNNAQSFLGKTEEEMGKFYREVFSINTQYINVKKYEQLSVKIFMRTYIGGAVRNEDDLMIYQNIMNDSLLHSEKPLTYLSQYHYYNIYSAYFFYRNDFVNAYSYAKELVALMGTHPHQIKEKLQGYLSMLGNLLTCQFNLKKYDEMALTIAKVKDISTKSKQIQSQLFFMANYTELNMYIDTGEFNNGIKLITFIQNEISKISLSKNNEISLYYSISYIYFGIGRYHDAKNYLNKIINDTTNDLRSDLYCMARIILLIVHYELGHEELLEYMEKSAHRYLDKKDRLYKVETSILDFMRKKIPKIITAQEWLTAFKELKTELEEITKDSFEKKGLEYFDFISWLESKIENRAFAEIVKEKMK